MNYYYSPINRLRKFLDILTLHSPTLQYTLEYTQLFFLSFTCSFLWWIKIIKAIFKVKLVLQQRMLSSSFIHHRKRNNICLLQHLSLSHKRTIARYSLVKNLEVRHLVDYFTSTSIFPRRLVSFVMLSLYTFTSFCNNTWIKTIPIMISNTLYKIVLYIEGTPGAFRSHFIILYNNLLLLALYLYIS